MAVNFEIPEKEIAVGTGGFTVRGLNSEDLVFLTEGYLDEIKAIVIAYGEKMQGRNPPRDLVADMAMEIVKGFPMVVAEIISRCAEAREEVDKFRKLPFIKQVEALRAIAELSSIDGGIDLGKAGQVLVSLLEARGLQLGPLTTQLQTIIDQYANQSLTS